MTFQPDDRILVNRAGQDYQAPIGPLLGGDDGITIGEDKPVDPTNGQIWVDTSKCPPQMMIWSECCHGGMWVEAGATDCPAPPPPWEDGNPWGVFHVKNLTDKIVFTKDLDYEYKVLDKDLNDLGKLAELTPGPEYIIMASAKGDGGWGLFAHNDTANWDFGELTDTSKCTDFTMLFSACYEFNGTGLEYFDTSNVESFYGCFYNCREFSGNVNGWNTGKAKSMRDMFYMCKKFNSSLAHFDTSKVTTMEGMFNTCEEFNQDISGWNVSKVKTFKGMFAQARGFNIDISPWNTSGVTSSSGMSSMFQKANSFYQDLSQWCVSSVGSKPSKFDYMQESGWKDQADVQPQWGTCPRGEK